MSLSVSPVIILVVLDEESVSSEGTDYTTVNVWVKYNNSVVFPYKYFRSSKHYILFYQSRTGDTRLRLYNG